jgi:hypothetical protein
MDSEQSGMRQEQVWHIGLLEYRERNTFMGGDDNVSMCQIHLICMFVSQMSSSNANQISLKNIPLHLSGKFRCEVSTDAPLFTTKCSEDELAVLGKPN